MMKQKYIQEAKHDSGHLPDKGRIVWESPSNIAFVKYWGKHDEQLPDNPSPSMTLNKSISRVEIDFYKAINEGGNFVFYFEDRQAPEFARRVEGFFEKMKVYFPFLEKIFLRINSRNTFPHSAGIASSASFMSVMALALCSLESFGTSTLNNAEFYRKASWMGRLGSGSASRSIFGKLAGWGKHSCIADSSDEYAIPLQHYLSGQIGFLKNAVLIVDSSPKKVSSSRGHEFMNEHFYAKKRKQQASENFERILHSMHNGKWKKFIQIVENEALSLHAMMLASVPGIMLLKQPTIDIIDAVRDFREKTGARIAFTLDAGSNVHVVYSFEEQEVIEHFVEEKLKPLTENNTVIYDQIGDGPVQKEIKNYD